MRTTVVVKFQIEGMHCWPDAAKELPHAAFLANPHRHIFHVTAERVVNHDDRDVEIIMFKKYMVDSITTKWRNATNKDWRSITDFGSMSCEMMAKAFIDMFDLISCEVLEDGENGARVVKIER